METLPKDVLRLILTTYVPPHRQVRCLRVCKLWKIILEGDTNNVLSDTQRRAIKSLEFKNFYRRKREQSFNRPWGNYGGDNRFIELGKFCNYCFKKVQTANLHFHFRKCGARHINCNGDVACSECSFARSVFDDVVPHDTLGDDIMKL